MIMKLTHRLHLSSRLLKLVPHLFVAAVSLNAWSAQTYIYQDENEQLLLTNIIQNVDGTKKFTQISHTYYPDSIQPSASNHLLVSTLSTPTTYDTLIIAAAQKYGVDPALIKSIMHAESSFNPQARSAVGAMGLMQLMPDTARSMGVTNAWDITQNIDGGVRYIAWLQKRFTNRDLVIAAYNAGLGNVQKYGGIPPFRETQNYVKKVNTLYRTLYQNNIHLAMSNP
ncbi:lytic transglycosylase domain-containing protein [Moraxella nasovis]|uniref:lytic transglycosylase domain-containing protein n=1 Tax=Moraxella nasovis TaxID=2904121 RepID=UPI002880ADA5|nr:lytic transglycosylase domain-containing protein [Moraxella nasovis]